MTNNDEWIRLIIRCPHNVSHNVLTNLYSDILLRVILPFLWFLFEFLISENPPKNMNKYLIERATYGRLIKLYKRK